MLLLWFGRATLLSERASTLRITSRFVERAGSEGSNAKQRSINITIANRAMINGKKTFINLSST
jgi:hypothetical protein